MIIRYLKEQSPLHHLNAISKLLAMVVYSAGIFLIDNLAFQACSLAAIAAADYTIGSKKLRAVLLSGFAFGLAGMILVMQVLVTSSGNRLLTLPIPWFCITDAGVLKGMLMTLRFLNVISIGAVFVATTDPVALVYSLMRAGVPYRYGFMLVMMMRFVPLFEAERTIVSNAQKMRGLELDRRDPRKWVLSIRHTVLPLAVSALAKSDVLAMSMEGRAFGCRPTRTFLTPDCGYSFADRVLIAASIAAWVLLFARFLLG